MGEEKWECCKCFWVGTDDEKEKVPSEWLKKQGVAGSDHACPKCGHKEFYSAELRG